MCCYQIIHKSLFLGWRSGKWESHMVSAFSFTNAGQAIFLMVMFKMTLNYLTTCIRLSALSSFTIWLLCLFQVYLVAAHITSTGHYCLLIRLRHRVLLLNSSVGKQGSSDIPIVLHVECVFYFTCLCLVCINIHIGFVPTTVCNIIVRHDVRMNQNTV